jgi:serine/threonine protein kinase
MEESFPFESKYDWKNKIKLGSGSYGVVYKVKKLGSEEFVAIKEMTMENFKD